MANLSFPGSINFLGELLLCVSLISLDPAITALILINLILSTIYSLGLYIKLAFDKHLEYKLKYNPYDFRAQLLNSAVFQADISSRH